MSATTAKMSSQLKAMCWTPEPKNSEMKRADRVLVATEPLRIRRRL